MRETIKTLANKLEQMALDMGNVHVSGHLVWSTSQVKDVLDKYDDDGGVIKVEITHGFEPGKRCYNVTVWWYPRIHAK